MSIDVRNLTIDSVLEPEEVEKLGELTNLDSTTSMKPVSSLESREFSNPETTALTGVGFNMAKDLNMPLSSDSEENIQEEIEKTIDRFAKEFGGEGENAVYVRDKVLDHLETDKASAFIKFQGLKPAYPITLRSEEDLEQELDTSRYEFGEEYLQEVRGRVVNNGFAIPAIYAGNNYFPGKTPVTVVYRAEDSLTLSSYDQFVNERLDNFDKGDAGFSEHPHIEERSGEDSYEVIIDCIGAGIESPNVEVSGDELIVYDGEDEIYRGDLTDIEVADGTVEGQLKNGVYDLRI